MHELTPREASLLALLAHSPQLSTFERIKPRLGPEAKKIALLILKRHVGSANAFERGAAKSISNWAHSLKAAAS